MEPLFSRYQPEHVKDLSHGAPAGVGGAESHAAASSKTKQDEAEEKRKITEEELQYSSRWERWEEDEKRFMDFCRKLRAGLADVDADRSPFADPAAEEPVTHKKVLLLVQAKSAGHDGGNHAEITLNGVPVFPEKNENDHLRGLHIVVLNPIDGKVLVARAFDTYATSKGFDKFITKGMPEGLIVIAACKDDCVTKLSDMGKRWFESMGSKEIRQVEYRCGFVFIGKGAMNEATEKRAMLVEDEVSVAQAFVVNSGFAGKRQTWADEAEHQEAWTKAAQEFVAWTGTEEAKAETEAALVGSIFDSLPDEPTHKKRRSVVINDVQKVLSVDDSILDIVVSESSADDS